MPNVELLRTVLEHIKRDPEHWDQSVWGRREITPDGGLSECGTSYCFAGWAVVLSGEQMQFPEPYAWDRQVGFVLARFVVSDNEVASERAAALLGISTALGRVLFKSDHDIEDLERLVDLIGRGQLSTCRHCHKAIEACARGAEHPWLHYNTEHVSCDPYGDEEPSMASVAEPNGGVSDD